MTVSPVTKVFAIAAVLLAQTAFAEKTVWLVRPLYPGQEALVERTEKALDKLIPAADRGNEIIGLKELGKALQGKSAAEIPCLTGDSRCNDPVDLFVGSFGFDRVVLIQGGQDEAGFKFRVVSYRPNQKEVTPATASNAILEKALLGAVAKVVPVASSLEVKTTPAGATVYIDDVKVGVTPLSSQVLPGERVIRLDLKLHQPIEETLVVPVRGSATLEKNLEKVAARIIVTASPAGTQIFLDGQPAGKDRVDRGISPGEHTIRLTAENHKAFEQTINVKAEEQYQLDKTLEPVPGLAPPPTEKIIIVKNDVAKVPPPQPPQAPPPPPLTETEKNYERTSYFHVSYEFAQLTGNAIVSRRFGEAGTGRTAELTSASRTLMGAYAEYGTFGKYFGLTVVGVGYLTNVERYSMNVGYFNVADPMDRPEREKGNLLPQEIDQVRVNMVTIRALHPQFRMAFWKFLFALQAGLEFRTGQILEKSNTPFYKDGFLITDLLVTARLNVRYYIVEGLFLLLQGNYTHYIVGNTAESLANPGSVVRSGGSFGFNGGFGYGF